ncbi:MAG: type III secretion protein HrpB4, partial [Burkholderiaceae bacterium]
MREEPVLVDPPVSDDADGAAADDSPVSEDGGERLARASACFGEMARTAACWAHPSWLSAPLGLDESAAARLQQTLAAGPSESARSVSAALLQHCRVGPAPFAALVSRKIRRHAASAALLCLVPPATRLRMLRMRALIGHTDELRRMIDRPARERLSQAIGVPLSEFVARTGHGARRSAARD